MFKFMRRRVRKWFDNECLLCGYPRVHRWRPFCSQLCRDEQRKRDALLRGRPLTEADVARMWQHYIYYGDEPMPAQVKDVDKPKGIRLEVYKDGGNRFRWRKVAANNAILFVCERGRRAKANVIKAARREHPHLPIIDLTVAA